MALTAAKAHHDTLREPCPACGQKWLLSAFGRLQDRCEHCGYDPVATPATSPAPVADASARVSPWLRNRSETILMGMPQLSLHGLSETWLLKQLGHQHWMMLASLAGQKVPNFIDERGSPVYAAFSSISIQDGDFASVRENDELVVRSRLRRVTQTQMLSRHRLVVGGRYIGQVEMVSVFVRRGQDGGNRSVSRFVVPGLPKPEPFRSREDLPGRAAAVRAGRASEHMGFALHQAVTGPVVTIDPCPAQDFNGAGFLYFSSFVSFVDRAEWQFDRDLARTATTLRRDIFFAGNLDPGETLSVGLVDRKDWQTPNEPPSGTRMLSHHCRLVRTGDNEPIAEVFTVRHIH
ncbi:Pnap_2097 family protein [Sphingobium sp. LB126]|uniref:Pnap_2097 family protein n=1 Tax=Sphingobium sp. LB126 TaxID=1983755 RepID=UPI0018D560F8|nr:Pnap_2097 family protein [Sphingobium sp. LB126]